MLRIVAITSPLTYPTLLRGHHIPQQTAVTTPGLRQQKDQRYILADTPLFYPTLSKMVCELETEKSSVHNEKLNINYILFASTTTFCFNNNFGVNPVTCSSFQPSQLLKALHA